MKQTIILLSAIFFFGCTKKDTPTTIPTNTTVNTTTVVQKLKWSKQNYFVQYNADGITEQTRLEYKYDSEGRILEYKYVANGILIYIQRDYTYNGDEATYYQDQYTNGSISSTSKCKVGYKND
jgi:hypothetical protein